MIVGIQFAQKGKEPAIVFRKLFVNCSYGRYTPRAGILREMRPSVFGKGLHLVKRDGAKKRTRIIRVSFERFLKSAKSEVTA